MPLGYTTTVILAVLGLAAPDTPAAILSSVQKVGPRATIEALYNENTWPKALAGIASGKPEWLQVYQLLRPGSDGEAGETLSDAITDAIPENPYAVLRILQSESGSDVEDICHFTFESELPAEGVPAYLDRIHRSLKNPTSGEEHAMARDCERGLAKTRADFGRTK